MGGRASPSAAVRGAVGDGESMVPSPPNFLSAPTCRPALQPPPGSSQEASHQPRSQPLHPSHCSWWATGYFPPEEAAGWCEGPWHQSKAPQPFSFFFNFLATLCIIWYLCSPPGIEPASSAWQVQSPNRWTAREVPRRLLSMG